MSTRQTYCSGYRAQISPHGSGSVSSGASRWAASMRRSFRAGALCQVFFDQQFSSGLLLPLELVIEVRCDLLHVLGATMKRPLGRVVVNHREQVAAAGSAWAVPPAHANPLM